MKDNETILTRAKAKELNKNPNFSLAPIKLIDPPPEIVALISEDLCSDEDGDEEYRPGDEDIPSEDDFLNTTASDIDSQPRTPYNASVHTEDEGTPKLSKDGLFKIPRDRNDSYNSQSEQDYIIAQRTRSKVSLEATAIETIESSFHPPDDEPNVAEPDGDDMFNDYNYFEFLNEIFNTSTEAVPNANAPPNGADDEDDEDDEDFHVANDDKVSSKCSSSQLSCFF